LLAYQRGCFYNWKAKFGGLEVSEASGFSCRPTLCSGSGRDERNCVRGYHDQRGRISRDGFGTPSLAGCAGHLNPRTALPLEKDFLALAASEECLHRRVPHNTRVIRSPPDSMHYASLGLRRRFEGISSMTKRECEAPGNLHAARLEGRMRRHDRARAHRRREGLCRAMADMFGLGYGGQAQDTAGIDGRHARRARRPRLHHRLRRQGL